MLLLLLPEFIRFTWSDALDILLVSILLFQLYRILKGSVAINIFFGIISVYFLWLLVKAFKMQMLSGILGQFVGVGVIALIIVFQPEIRRFLLLIGTTGFFSKGRFRFLFSGLLGEDSDKPMLAIHSMIRACKNMAESRTGAIMVVATKTDLGFYANTGDPIEARVSSRLLESIFYKNSPLHDGAVIIDNNQIKAARCVLPVSERDDFPAQLGMRHRAASGITESTDAVAIIVSEQTGDITYSINGELEQNLKPEELKERLEKVFRQA